MISTTPSLRPSHAATAARHLLFATLLAFVAATGFAHEGTHGEVNEGDLGVVQAVVAGGPAAEAGLLAGDRLLRLAGREIHWTTDLGAALSGKVAGDTVPLDVERDGEIVELELTLGGRSDGGVSLGVSLALGQPPRAQPSAADAPLADGFQPAECRQWIRDTYRVAPLADELGLDLGPELEALASCMTRDTHRMAVPIPVGWCDNVFKIHCSGLDLLVEVGEALEARCARELDDAQAAEGGAEIRDLPRWRSCALDEVFDRYSRHGAPAGGDLCREAWDACAASE